MLPPDMLARCGMREALQVLENELAKLRACIYPIPNPEGIING